jgi:hypothetical protein
MKNGNPDSRADACFHLVSCFVGPSLLIGAFLILAVRTVKWAPRARGGTTSDRELDVEIEKRDPSRG